MEIDEMHKNEQLAGYIACHKFIEEMNKTLPCDEFIIILSGMALLNDERSADPSYLDIYLKFYNKALLELNTGKIDESIIFKLYK
jgi:hypothetical protein